MPSSPLSLPTPLPSIHLSRRRALQAFVVGGVGTAGLVLASSPAVAQSSLNSRFLAGDLQIVTVTESELTVTWCTWSTTRLDNGRPTGVDTEGTLRVWPVDNPPDVREVSSEKATSFHVLTVSGLRPGTRYRIEASSEGLTPLPVANIYEGPFDTVTTLDAPVGESAGTMVVTNDTHISEDRDGIIFGNFPPPAMQVPGDRPYGEIMLESVIAGAHAAGASQLYVNGDLTAEARPDEIATAKRILDTFNGQWRVTRGNHDRPHDATVNPDYASAPGTAGRTLVARARTTATASARSSSRGSRRGCRTARVTWVCSVSIRPTAMSPAG